MIAIPYAAPPNFLRNIILVTPNIYNIVKEDQTQLLIKNKIKQLCFPDTIQ